MKNIKILLIYTMITMVSFNAPQSLAREMSEEDGGHYGAKKEGKMDKIMQELGLTDEQKEKLKEMKDAQRESGKEIRAQQREKREEMRKELEKTEPDLTKINKLIDEMAELDKQKTKNRVQGILDMKKVLTPEQYKALNEKFHEKMKEKKKFWQRKRQHWEE